MASIQHLHMLLFLLLLMACIDIQFAEGRQLRAMKEHELSPVKTETGLKNHAKQATKVKQSLGDHKDNLHVTEQKIISPPLTPTQDHELRSSDVSEKDTFQPRTQGNSPGVGHSFPGKSRSMQPKVQDFRVDAGETDALESTTQGHSPGVGHSVGN